jgi:uroporphyrinogen decarboxylase
MFERMTHKERIAATLAGRETDRVPVSMWRHFFESESSPESLAEAMLGFQAHFDWDFMKVNPRASYHAEGWGLEMSYNGDQKPVAKSTPIKSPDDWLKLDVLKPYKGVLGEHLKALELIERGLGGNVPFLMTVFTPVSIAAKLAPSKQAFVTYLHQHTERVCQALEVVTETFIGFSKACLERGASGLFFATTDWASSEWLSAEEYQRLARPYDLRLLNSLPAAEFNVLHVCEPHNYLKHLGDYPVHAFNWDARAPGNMSMAQGKALLKGKVVIGGIAHDNQLVSVTPERLAGEVTGLRAAMGKKGWMLAPGCTFPPDTPEANVDAIRQAVEQEL